MSSGTDVIRVLAKRESILQSLNDQPKSKGELDTALGCSRSTITRGLTELEKHGLVRQTRRGYALTIAGRTAVTLYNRKRSILESVSTHSSLLNTRSKPDNSALEPLFLYDTETIVASRESPKAPVEEIKDRIMDSERLTLCLPEPQQLIFDCISRVQRSQIPTNVDVFVPEAAASNIETADKHPGTEREGWSQVVEYLTYSGTSMYSCTNLPPYCIIATSNSVSTVITDRYGHVRGLIITESGSAVACMNHRKNGTVADQLTCLDCELISNVG